MPKNAFKMAFKLTTRNKYTELDCEIGMTVDGRELPTMAILGSAMEEAVELIQKRVTDSYAVVPPRAEVILTPDQNAVSVVTPKPATENRFS
jgi:hypothetical protein